MIAKHQKARRRIILSSKKDGNDENDTKDKTNSNHSNDEYLLPNWEAMRRKL